MSRVVPAGFGAPFWAERVEGAVVQNLLRNLTTTSERSLVEAIVPVLEELIAQTRLDEALVCHGISLQNRHHHDAQAKAFVRRIVDHRRDLRAAKKAGKR